MRYLSAGTMPLPSAFRGPCRGGEGVGVLNPPVGEQVVHGGGDPRPGDGVIRVDLSRFSSVPGALPRAFNRGMVAQRTPALHNLYEFVRFRGGTSRVDGGYAYFVDDPANHQRIVQRRLSQQPLYDRLTPQRRATYVAPRYGYRVSDQAVPSFNIRDSGAEPKLVRVSRARRFGR